MTTTTKIAVEGAKAANENRQNADDRALLTDEHRVLILASQSLQRLTLLRQIGFDPLSIPAHADETAQVAESARDLVRRLSALKAQSVAASDMRQTIGEASDSTVILGADTVIELDGQILGKPCDEADAVHMLKQLSGREHDVHTGVSVYEQRSSNTCTTCVTTTVLFCDISTRQAKSYWQTGEPRNKAGAYAIQGLGAQFVIRLSGSYSNVVGLPLYESAQLLSQAGLHALR